MKTSKLLAICGACAVTGAPAAVALAAEGPEPSPLTAHSPIVPVLARHQAEHEVLRLARRKARLADRHVRRAYVRGVQSVVAGAAAARAPRPAP